MEWQLAIDEVTQWSDKWQLKLNAAKTNKLIIKADKLHNQYKQYDLEIENMVSMYEYAVKPEVFYSLNPYVIKKVWHIIFSTLSRAMIMMTNSYIYMCVMWHLYLLESTQIRLPIQKCNTDRVDAVQGCFTSESLGLHHFSYAEMLERLTLESLEPQSI